MIGDLRDSRGLQVQGGDGRCDDGAILRDRHHGAQMPERKRALAHHEHEPPSLLEVNIGGADEQVAGDAGNKRRNRIHRAGRDDHASCLERAAPERAGPDLVVSYVRHAPRRAPGLDQHEAPRQEHELALAIGRTANDWRVVPGKDRRRWIECGGSIMRDLEEADDRFAIAGQAVEIARELRRGLL